MKSFLKYYILDRLVLLKKEAQLRFWKRNSPILIHTMAKVGSLSVYKSLKTSLPKTAMFHTHSLDKNDVQKDIDICFDNGVYPRSRNPVFLIQDHIISNNKPYKIITLYRDPIERNLSAFFDAFKLYVGVNPIDYKGDLKALEKVFHEHIPYTYPLQWFDDYMLKDTQIDVYKYPFDADLGYVIINEENKKLLLMNCCIKDGLKEQLIGEFCGVSNFKLQNTNITENGESGELYKAFKSHIRFTEDYLNEYYSSKYAKHFFTPSQRKFTIAKWLRS